MANKRDDYGDISRFFSGTDNRNTDSPFIGSRDGHDDVAQRIINEEIGNRDNTRADPLSYPAQLPGIGQSQMIDPSRLDSLRSVYDPDDPTSLRRVPQAVYEPGRYGDAFLIPYSLPTNGSLLILERPKNKRIYLRISQIQGVPTQVGFGIPANVSSTSLALSGDLVFDRAVPQNDIYIAALGNPSIGFILYMNRDIETAN